MKKKYCSILFISFLLLYLTSCDKENDLINNNTKEKLELRKSIEEFINNSDNSIMYIRKDNVTGKYIL